MGRECTPRSPGPNVTWTDSTFGQLCRYNFHRRSASQRAMELVLNLLWLTLAVPAILIWRRGVACPHASGHSCRSLVLLGCVLTLLFPVISATDDLHPMRAEIEESSTSKRLAKQALSVKPLTCSLSGGVPSLPIETASFIPTNCFCELVSNSAPALPGQTLMAPTGGRAPPAA